MVIVAAPRPKRRVRHWTYEDRKFSGRRIWYLWDLGDTEDRVVGRVFVTRSDFRGRICADFEVKQGRHTIHQERIDTRDEAKFRTTLIACRDRLEAVVGAKVVAS